MSIVCGFSSTAFSQLVPEVSADWDGAGVLCHASNFRPVKRPLEVVRAFALLRARRPAFLILAGDGPERARVEEEVRATGLSSHVSFTGPARDLATLLRASDLFLLPSSAESFGLAALEAMSCGVPVLATRVGGLPEVVGDGETGLLFPLGATSEMAEAAAALLADSARRAEMGRAARQRAMTLFRSDPIMDRWEQLYSRVLHAKRER